MAHERIHLDGFKENFSATTELSSVALGGQIIAVSDEFFAEAFHLLLVEPAPSLKGQFGPKGALYSGWESRRHNPTYDWCIIKLGTSGTIVGFDIDTSNFNGNEAPEVSVDILHSLAGDPSFDDSRWSQVLPKVNLGPNSRHLFKIHTSDTASYVKLNMYPDGGIARFRVYGHVTPIFPRDPSLSFDLAHVFAGGRVIYTSDQHFGVGSNIILPGRGKDMGDGWETKRSRVPGHKDWAVVQLGAPGLLEYAEIDTSHFKGNYPESCELHALSSTAIQPGAFASEGTPDGQQLPWVEILPRTKLGSHRQHYFQLENVSGRSFTHVKVTIHPDGGIKRLRIIGLRAGTPSGTTASAVAIEQPNACPEGPVPTTLLPQANMIHVLPLTPEAFAPFGHVIQSYPDLDAAPRGTKITSANQGTATKFHKLAPIVSSYPSEAGALPGLSVYRCKPLEDIDANGTVSLLTLERHPYTNQAFIPMGQGEGNEKTSARYLVVVAHNGKDDRPDLKTLRAFIATSNQGIAYATGIWHQPMTVLDKTLDMACVETQIGDGSASDCEVLELDQRENNIRLKLPNNAQK